MRAVVEAFNAAWDAHDLQATLALVTEDCVFESARPGVNGARVVGRDALAVVWAPSFARGGAPFDIEETIVAGDRVVTSQLTNPRQGMAVVEPVPRSAAAPAAAGAPASTPGRDDT